MRLFPTQVARSVVCVCALGTPVRAGKQLNRSRCRLGADSRGLKKALLDDDRSAYWRHMANTIKRPVRGNDAALC